LGTRLAEELQVRKILVESKLFADGESYLRFTEDLRGQELVIVQSCYPQQDKKLIELLFMLDAAKELGAKKVVAVVPYLAYARQDKRFRDGEIVSNASVGKLIGTLRTDVFLTVDVHQKDSLKNFGTKTINISAMPLLAKHLKNLELIKPYILAPDQGASGHAQLVATVLGADHTYFTKQRDRVTGQVVTADRDLQLQGRDVVVLDDMISTGSTIANVARIAKGKGGARIIAACTHALLVGNAEETIRKAGVTDIIGTDTVPCSVSKVSVAPAIANSLRQLL
jgi:ribose-phosphate pyrophosphokinase